MADLITNETWNQGNSIQLQPSEASETATDDGRPKELKKGLPIKRVPSDDCLIYPKKMFATDEAGVPTELKERGEGVAVHVGEWVEIVPMASMFQYLRLEKVSDLAFDAVCENLSKKIVRWTWTDIVGQPYPQPFRNPDVLRTLEDDELLWLITLAQTGETESEIKNA